MDGFAVWNNKQLVVESPGAPKLRLDRSRHGVDVVLDSDSPYVYEQGTLGSVRIPLAHRSGVSPSLGLDYPVVINPRNSKGEEGVLVLPRGQSFLLAKPVGKVRDVMDLRRIFSKEQAAKKEQMERLARSSAERIDYNPEDEDLTEESILKQVRATAKLAEAKRSSERKDDIPSVEIQDTWQATPSRFSSESQSSTQVSKDQQGVITMDAGFEERIKNAIATAVGEAMGAVLAKVSAAQTVQAAPAETPVSNGTIPKKGAKETVSEDITKAFAKLRIPKLGPKPFKPRHRVLFLLPGGARMTAYYHWVWVSPTNNDLFLISDLRSTKGSVFDPPVTQGDEVIQVVVGNKRFSCHSLDCVLEFGCFRIVCLPAAKSGEYGEQSGSYYGSQDFQRKQSMAMQALNPFGPMPTQRMPPKPSRGEPSINESQEEPSDEFYPQNLDDLG
jgi:hypothetical protein